MKTRSELKREVKDNFRGHWGKAILVAIIPVILTVITVFMTSTLILLIATYLKYQTENALGAVDTSYSNESARGFGSNIVITIITTMIYLGIDYTYLDWLRGKAVDTIKPISSMFQVFSKKYFFPVLVLYIIQYVLVILWSLLLIIPGIIKGYSYSQTYYIYKDIEASGQKNNYKYPDYVTLSRKLMNGYKWKLFMLDLSFIGWHILALISGGIGYIWLFPYMKATKMAFYRNLAGDKFLKSENKVYDAEFEEL